MPVVYKKRVILRQTSSELFEKYVRLFFANILGLTSNGKPVFTFGEVGQRRNDMQGADSVQGLQSSVFASRTAECLFGGKPVIFLNARKKPEYERKPHS